MIWRFRGHEFDLSARSLIVGILNATPDSFSDGGAFLDPESACAHGMSLLADGAQILDIGGESTRPGAIPVTAEEEMSRIVPVIRKLRGKTSVPISIDTSKAVVAEAALRAGADIINDVTALRGDPGMQSLAKKSGAGLILMHMQGNPETMQQNPSYPNDDVVESVAKFLSARRDAAIGFGVDSAAIILDPGLGFGKTVEHNLALIRNLPRLIDIGSPMMIGHSRKSFLGSFDKKVGGKRIWPGVAVTCLAWQLGARLFRVHDPLPHLEALRMTEAVLRT